MDRLRHRSVQDLLPLKLDDWGSNPVLDPGNPPMNTSLGDINPTVITSWNETIDAAEAHNDPGKFTALLGWEWSSIPAGANLHRVVITPNGREQAAQYMPYGSGPEPVPEPVGLARRHRQPHRQRIYRHPAQFKYLQGLYVRRDHAAR